jgi:lipid-A-disaccharide synthase
MRVFISAGEPSGDIHGANLIHALRQLRPDIKFDGFGGDHMQAAGCQLLYPLCQLAVMFFLRVLLNLRKFFKLLAQADHFFEAEKPDALILIDYPGFNWHMARKAHARGIPVFYFVPPQLWAWAGWRVNKMRRWVDHVLCNLPFEQEWYAERGVNAVQIGHPYFDELAEQVLDSAFLEAQRQKPGPIVAILPGSRHQELDRNLSSLLEAARQIHAQRSDVRFLVACLRPDQQQRVQRDVEGMGLPIEVHCGRTAEIIELADACAAVSGSVSLELLYREVPSVILYRVRWLDLKVGRFFMRCPYITLVNLLAHKELFPEYLTARCEARSISQHILGWLNDPTARASIRQELRSLRKRYAAGGACERAALYVLQQLEAAPVKQVA